jgi:hypothetical protein
VATVLGEIALIGASTVISLLESSTIGGVTIQALVEETHDDTLEMTDHPIEQGAEITDHSYVNPTAVLLRCGWSNSSTEALLGAVSSLFSDGASSTGADYVSGIYSQLLALQQSRQPFTISTPLRTYENMLMPALRVTRDQKTYQALMVTATCREAILVSTQTTTIPPQANQADPSNTADTQNMGSQSLQPGTPAPGGSSDPDDWTP